MKITLDEWTQIDLLAQEARKTIDALVQKMDTIALEHLNKGNHAEAQLLLDWSEKVSNFALLHSLLIQTQWMGGNTWKKREPDCVHIPHVFHEQD